MVDLYVDGVLKYHCIPDSKANHIASELGKVGKHRIATVFVLEDGRPLTKEELTPIKE